MIADAKQPAWSQLQFGVLDVASATDLTAVRHVPLCDVLEDDLGHGELAVRGAEQQRGRGARLRRLPLPVRRGLLVFGRDLLLRKQQEDCVFSDSSEKLRKQEIASISWLLQLVVVSSRPPHIELCGLSLAM